MVITDDRLDPPDTQELLARARGGEVQAFCALIEPLQTRLLRQATALAGDLNVAEDLVSETLVEAWKSLPRYNETCRFSTWLYAILLHRYQKSVHRARSRPVALSSLSFFESQVLNERQRAVPAPENSPDEVAVRNELFLRLRQCVGGLSEKHRQIILLRFFEDASLSDTAAVLGCSVGTVKSRLHHALEILRRMKMNLPASGEDK